MLRILCAAVFALATLACTAPERVPVAASPPPSSVPSHPPEIDELRALLDEARTSRKDGDHDGARARIASAIEQALPAIGGSDDEAALDLMAQMGRFAHECGELGAAEAARTAVYEVRERTLPEEHLERQRARTYLAATKYMLGDLPSARALQEQVLEISLRTLPADHISLQVSRGNLAVTLFALGDAEGSRALFEQALEVLSRTLPDDHPDLNRTRANLTAVMCALGDFRDARALQEKVLEWCTRTLPADDPNLLLARGNLAATLYTLGDLHGARALQEQVLEVCSCTMPEDHPDIQLARGNLALTLDALGDLPAARAIEEAVLESMMRTLPDDHADLQGARNNLAGTLAALGDLEGARALQQEVLEVYSRTLEGDHLGLLRAKGNLAITMGSLGGLEEARSMQEEVLALRSRALPEDDPELQNTRLNLATILVHQIARGVRAEPEKSETAGDPVRDRELCLELVGAMCRSRTKAARDALLESSPREAESRCELLSWSVGEALSFADGLGTFGRSPELERAAFVLSETTRGAALSAAALMRRAVGAPRCAELRQELRERSGELAHLVQTGATSESFQRALVRREAVERELAALARELSGGTEPALDFDLEAIAAVLAQRDAVVAYRGFKRWVAEEADPNDPRAKQTSIDSLCAFVMRNDLTVIDLGPISPIEEAVLAWRESLGAGADARGVGPGASP